MWTSVPGQMWDELGIASLIASAVRWREPVVFLFRKEYYGR